MPRGYGGTAILWRKDIDTIVTPLTIGNNRIQCIKITRDPNLLIISVYVKVLPTVKMNSRNV
jgi:hypothetical protein